MCRNAGTLQPFAAVMVLLAVLSQAVNAATALDRIGELDSSKLTAQQKANTGLHLYRDEMVHPTPRPAPPYTDHKTHDYVLAEITRKLAEVDADVPTLKKTWETANPGEVKDSLAIFLALKGQPEAKDPVAKYVLNRVHPMRLRELGVEALGAMAVKTNDPKLGDVIAQVVREDNQAQYKGGQGKAGGAITLVYPVRRAGVEAIKKMEKEGMLLPSYVTEAAARTQVEVKVDPRGPGASKPTTKPAPVPVKK